MGILTTPKYDGLETEGESKQIQSHKTQAGAVAHNGQMGREAGRHPAAMEAGQYPGTPQGAEPAADMANELLTPADTESQSEVASPAGHELDAFLGKAFESKGTFAGLYESIHDIFFPKKLPPLVLTSAPIPVPDRMAVKMNPIAVGAASIINCLILVALLYFGARIIIDKITKPNLTATNVEIEDYIAPKSAVKAGGGGGGGDHSLVDPMKGKLPKLEKDPVVPGAGGGQAEAGHGKRYQCAAGH
jgi:hypothetical protein